MKKKLKKKNPNYNFNNIIKKQNNMLRSVVYKIFIFAFKQTNIKSKLPFFLKAENSAKRLKILLTKKCLQTGQGKSYLKKFNISRHIFKQSVSKGLIPGYFRY